MDVKAAIYVLAGLAIALLILTQWIFLRIRTLDSGLYERLGRPEMFQSNNIHNMLTFWRWIYGESFSYKGSRVLLQAIWVLRAATAIYLLFIALLLVTQW